MTLFKSLTFATVIMTAQLACPTAVQAAATTTDRYFENTPTDKDYLGENSRTAGSSNKAAIAAAWSSFSISGSATYNHGTLSFKSDAIEIPNRPSNLAVDNQHASEFILLHIGKPVSLTSLQTGWPANSTDITLKTYTDYTGVDANSKVATQPKNDVYSNYWLAGTYNDYIFPNGLVSISHTPSTAVALPTTAALFGLGLLILGRKKIQLKKLDLA